MPSIRDLNRFKQDVLFSTQIPGQGWKVLVFGAADRTLSSPQPRVVLLRTSFAVTDEFSAANPDFPPAFPMEAAQIVFRTTDREGLPEINSLVYVDRDWAYRLDSANDSDNTQMVYRASRVTKAELAKMGPTPPQLPLK